MLKYGRESFNAFSNHAKTSIHIKNSKKAKEAFSLNQFKSKSKEGNIGHSDQYVDFHSRKVGEEVLFSLFLSEKFLSFILV